MGQRIDPPGQGQYRGLLQQAIEAERIPIKQLEARKAKEESRGKLFGTFKTKFNALQKALDDMATFKKFKEFKAILGDGEKIVDVTLDQEKVQPGTYNIEILEAGTANGVISAGVTDPNEDVFGSGYAIGYSPTGEKFEAYVEGGSMRSIASAINNDPKSPIQAEVIQDAYDMSAPFKLIVKNKKDGLTDGDYPDFYFVGGKQDLWVDDATDAQNATLMIDGFEIEAQGNNIKEFLTGVNMNIKRAAPGEPFILKIEPDYKKISAKMKDLVDQANGVLEFISQQNTIDDKTDTSVTFAGDTGLQTIEYRLRNMVHEGYLGGFNENDDPIVVHLNKLGIEFDRTGKLKFNESKFEKEVNGNFDQVAEAISGEKGLARQLGEVVRGYTRPMTGLIANREKSLQDRVKKIDQDIANKERIMDRKIGSLKDQFARMEVATANLQRQQAYVQASMSGIGQGIGQLLG